MFGLKNCIFFCCVMNGFFSMKKFYSRLIEVCPSCLRKIFTNISRKYERLDDDGRVKNAMIILDRLKNLRDCLKENFVGIFDKELDWYNDRIESLNKELFGEQIFYYRLNETYEDVKYNKLYFQRLSGNVKVYEDWHDGNFQNYIIFINQKVQQN